MVSFKKHFVSNLPAKVKKKLDKQWIIQEPKKNTDQEELEVDLMKNPFGVEPVVEVKKIVKFSRNNELLEGKALDTKVEF